jgi:allophanate hydrolase subunit 1
VTGIRAAGETALLRDLTDAGRGDGNGPAGIAAAIGAAALPGVVDVVPAAATLLVTVRPGPQVRLAVSQPARGRR